MSSNKKQPSIAVNVTEPDYVLQILKSLRRIIRSTELHSRQLVANHKVTIPQLMSLHIMSEVRKTTATQLARRLYLSTSTIVGILDRLENKNLITRTRNRGDRRVVYLRLTKDGKKVAATAPILLQDKLYKALLSLPELERATIALSLEKIVGLMDADKIDGAPIIDSGPLDQSEEEKALRPKSLENL